MRPSVVPNARLELNFNYCGGQGGIFCYAVQCTTPTTCVSTAADDSAGDPDFDACAAQTLDLSSATECEAILTASASDAADAKACTYTAGDSVAHECDAGHYVSDGRCATCNTIDNAVSVTCTSGSDETATLCADGYYPSLRVVEACTVVAGTPEEESAAATTCTLTPVNHNTQTAGSCAVATGSGSCQYVAPVAAGISCETCPSAGDAVSTVCVPVDQRRSSNDACPSADANGWDDGVCVSAQSCPAGSYRVPTGTIWLRPSGSETQYSCNACANVHHAVAVTCTTSGDSVAASCNTDFVVTEAGRCACDAGKYLTTEYTPDPNGSVLVNGQPHSLTGSCPDCAPVSNAATVTCSSNSNSASDSVAATCNNGYDLENGACVCADGTYDDGNGACAACTSRAPDSGACACRAGTYDDSSGGCATCNAVTNAATVTCTSSSDSVAATCNEPFVVSGGECACRAGTYGDGAGGCQTCGSVVNAASVVCTSDSDQVATACDYLYELTETGACVCQSGTYAGAPDGPWAGQCVQCEPVDMAETVTCTSASDSVAATCRQQYTVSDGGCVCTCETGFYRGGGYGCSCQSCPAMGDYMGQISTASTTCDPDGSNPVAATCNDGFVLNAGTCSCPEGAVFSDPRRACITSCTPLEGDCVCDAQQGGDDPSDGCMGCLTATDNDMQACMPTCTPLEGDCVCDPQQMQGGGPPSDGCVGCLTATDNDMQACMPSGGEDSQGTPPPNNESPPPPPEPTCTAGTAECVCTPVEGTAFRGIVEASMASSDEQPSVTLSASCASCLTGRNPMENGNPMAGANTDLAFLNRACVTEMAACAPSATCMTYMELLRKLQPRNVVFPPTALTLDF